MQVVEGLLEADVSYILCYKWYCDIFKVAEENRI